MCPIHLVFDQHELLFRLKVREDHCEWIPILPAEVLSYYCGTTLGSRIDGGAEFPLNRKTLRARLNGKSQESHA